MCNVHQLTAVTCSPYLKQIKSLEDKVADMQGFGLTEENIGELISWYFSVIILYYNSELKEKITELTSEVEVSQSRAKAVESESE